MDRSLPRVAIVGCGYWGKNLARNFHQLGVLAGVCDHTPEKAIQFSETYQTRVFDFDSLCKSNDIDAIAIATPSWTHEALAIQVLSHGKHVYVEKPFTLSSESALAIDSLAQRQNKVLMVGHLSHYHRAFQALKQMVHDGVLGEIYYISTTRCSTGKFPTEKSVLWDLAPHDVSMILGLMNAPPTAVSAHAGQFLSHTTDDTFTIHLEFGPHIKAQINVSWLHPYKEQKMIVCGSKGMAIFSDAEPWDKKLSLYLYPSIWSDGLPTPVAITPQPIALEPDEPLRQECEHFIDCIQTQKIPLTSGLEAYRVTKILETAYLQVKSIPTNLKQPV